MPKLVRFVVKAVTRRMAALFYERAFELEKLQAQLCKSSLYNPHAQGRPDEAARARG